MHPYSSWGTGTVHLLVQSVRENYYMTTNTPQVAINDIGSADLIAAIDETIKYFNDGDIVEASVVKVDHDEVLLGHRLQDRGCDPSPRELSIANDVNPGDVVAAGDQIEALRPQKEDKEGRLLSKKRAQYERAWGQIEGVKEEDGVVTGTVIEVVKAA